MARIRAAGIEAGQRQLNGPQTTGRDYRNLSPVAYSTIREDNVAIPMRDGTLLLADIRRPAAEGAFPALLAASPYPRQLQDLGAPAILLLQDIAPDGTATDVTQGWLRAGLREVDEAASTPGRPVLPLRTMVPVPRGELVHYRIPLVANARRFRRGHQLRLTLTSDDTGRASHAMQLFTHTPVGTTTTNTVYSSSRLLVPVLASAGEGGRNK